MIDTSDGDAAHRRRLAAHLDAMLALCETVECRRVSCSPTSAQQAEPCGNCDTCTEPAAVVGRHGARAEAAVDGVAGSRERGQRYGAGHVVDILLGKRRRGSRSSGTPT